MDIKDKIYKDLAIQYGLTKYQIELITTSPFTFLKDIMQDGEFKSLMLPHWGKYLVKPYRKIKIDENIKNNRKHNRGMDKLLCKETISGENLRQEEENM